MKYAVKKKKRKKKKLESGFEAMWWNNPSLKRVVERIWNRISVDARDLMKRGGGGDDSLND